MQFTPYELGIINNAPTTETARGIVATRTLEFPPKELTTGEELLKWAYEHTKMPIMPSNLPTTHHALVLTQDVREYGSARYSVSATRQLMRRIDLPTIVGWARESQDLDEFLTAVSEHIEDAPDNREVQDYGDYNYSDHDSSDLDVDDSSLSSRTREVLRDLLRVHAPDLHRHLYGGGI